jgi:hypothetical protein
MWNTSWGRGMESTLSLDRCTPHSFFGDRNAQARSVCSARSLFTVVVEAYLSNLGAQLTPVWSANDRVLLRPATFAMG